MIARARAAGIEVIVATEITIGPRSERLGSHHQVVDRLGTGS